MMYNSNKKKVLVATLWDGQNIGNRLQAYALKKIIEKSGFEPFFLDYKHKYFSALEFFKYCIIYILNFFGIDLYTFVIRKDKRRRVLFKETRNVFKDHIIVARNYKLPNCISVSDYSAAVAGSDQVWHKWFNTDELKFFYLEFFPQAQRISYAASFGFEEIPKDDYNYHKQGLNGINYLSCREQSGQKLIKDLINKDAELVLDPTLCLSKLEWEEYGTKPYFRTPTKYYLCYFLGEYQPWLTEIIEYGKEKGVEILDICNVEDKRVWNITTKNFVWLVNNSSGVFTDSFHCTVFSILFNKPFLVFNRIGTGFTGMFDRIDTLLQLTNLNTCKYSGKTVCLPEVDYKLANNIIQKKAGESTDWLEKSLRSCGNDNCSLRI